MKKTLIIFAGILLAVYVLLSVLDMKGQYVAEQKIWNADQQLLKAAREPAALPDQKFEQIADQYRRIIKNFPDSLSTPYVHISLARVYMVKKDYPKVRKELEPVCSLYPNNLELCAQAKSIMARSHELEDNWPQALTIYEEIIRDYPATQTGLNIPLYIASYYQYKNDTSNVSRAYSKAVVHYKKLADIQEGTFTGFSAMRSLVTTYLNQQKWQNAVETLGDILLQYHQPQFLNSQRADLLVKSINTISITELKDYDLPIRIYQGFISRLPDHPLSPILTQMVKALEDLRDQNVKIRTKKD